MTATTKCPRCEKTVTAELKRGRLHGIPYIVCPDLECGQCILPLPQDTKVNK